MQTHFLLFLLSFSLAVELREQSFAFPWRVSISFEGFDFCSGAVISDTLVLTAGSCLAIFDEGTSLDIVLGDGQRTSSDETIVHPDFNSTSLYADLGIIRLPKPFQVLAFISTFTFVSFQAPILPLSLIALPGCSFGSSAARWKLAWGWLNLYGKRTNCLVLFSTSLSRLLPWYQPKLPWRCDLRGEWAWQQSLQCRNSRKSWRCPTRRGRTVEAGGRDGQWRVKQLPGWIPILDD